MNWPIVTIAEFIDRGEANLQTGPFGTQLSASDYVEKGIPVINVRNIGYGRIREEKLEYLDDETADRLRIHRLKRGDIVFGRKGSSDRHVLIDEKTEGWFQGSDCLRLRIKSALACNSFFSYFFNTSGHKEWMEAVCSFGATMTSLNQDIVRQIKIPLPPLPIQRRIAEVLGRYDALIENYQRQIGLLEALAQNLYREWFVRGRCPGVAAASLFELKSLSEIARVNVQTISEKDENAEINYVDISSVGTGRINEITPYALKDAPGRARRLVQHGDIVFSTVRPENRSYALILSPTRNLVFSTGFAVITPNEPFYSSFVYCSISTDAFITEIANKAKGAAYPQVGFDDLMATKLAAPSDDVLMKFHRLAEPIFLKAENLQAQIAQLRQMRDKLLPRLMSGQLAVSCDGASSSR